MPSSPDDDVLADLARIVDTPPPCPQPNHKRIGPIPVEWIVTMQPTACGHGDPRGLACSRCILAVLQLKGESVCTVCGRNDPRPLGALIANIEPYTKGTP